MNKLFSNFKKTINDKKRKFRNRNEKLLFISCSHCYNENRKFQKCLDCNKKICMNCVNEEKTLCKECNEDYEFVFNHIKKEVKMQQNIAGEKIFIIGDLSDDELSDYEEYIK